MANALAKDLELMFETAVSEYDAACVISREAETSYPDPQAMQRAGDTFYKKQSYNATVTTGMDISLATPTDVIERFVPTVYRSPDNVLYYLDAKEMRDPDHKARMGRAAALKLAATIDANLYSTVASRAAIVVKSTSALSWDNVATAEALMLSRGIGAGERRKVFMNPFDYLAVSSNLAGRAYLGDINKSAYERSQVPDIAGFATFRTDNVANLTTVGTVTSITVSGTQSHTVTAMTGDLPTDNRLMSFTTAGGNAANVNVGDCFTIPGVNAVHNIDKSDTGQLMTFRVLAKASATSWTISPAIIASGPYQNVTAAAAGGATLAFLNTATKPVNAFWAQGAVTLDYGNLAFPSGEGPQVMRATTKNGVPIVMSYSFNHLTAKTSVRFTTLYATTVIDPEKCGIILANQV